MRTREKRGARKKRSESVSIERVLGAGPVLYLRLGGSDVAESGLVASLPMPSEARRCICTACSVGCK